MKIKSSHKLIVFCFISASLLIYSCGGGNKGANGMSKQDCLDSIKAVETKLKTLNTPTPDPYTYSKAITSYMQFASNFPADTLAPLYLFRAATFASSLNQFQRAINIYDTITTKYPTFNRAAECLFSRANLYDDKMKDTAKAHVLYQQVIDKYPNDTWASQAKFAIKNLGKTPDEIINSFSNGDSTKTSQAPK